MLALRDKANDKPNALVVKSQPSDSPLVKDPIERDSPVAVAPPLLC
jgi:hypothetical protein